MYQRLLSDDECSALEVQIVREFGNGNLEPGRYVWEQVLADRGFLVKVSKAIRELPEGVVLVLLERHPSNNWDAEKIATRLGAPGKRGFVVNRETVQAILGYDACDLFVASPEGHLLILGCHEDQMEDGERLVWMPKTHTTGTS